MRVFSIANLVFTLVLLLSSAILYMGQITLPELLDRCYFPFALSAFFAEIVIARVNMHLSGKRDDQLARTAASVNLAAAVFGVLALFYLLRFVAG